MNINEISYDPSTDVVLGVYLYWRRWILQDKINLYEYNDEDMKEVDATVIRVTKFFDLHDFEHG